MIPDKSIDLVLTDPPYEFDDSGGGGAFGDKKREYHREMKDNRNAFKDGVSNDIFKEFIRIMKRLNCYIFCNKNQILQILDFFKNYNYDILSYHKTNPTPTCNNKYLSDTEYIIYIREKGVKLYGDYHSKKKYFIQENAKSKWNHPTIKPMNIIQTLIENSTLDNELVLDPFMGSWTTARACKDLGRDFIGFELSEEYCKIGEQRLAQQNLF